MKSSQPRVLSMALLLISVGCGGARTSNSAAPSAPSTAPVTHVSNESSASVPVLEIQPFALFIRPGEVLARLLSDGTLQGPNMASARLRSDGHFDGPASEVLGFSINAAGEVMLQGIVVARIVGNRMTLEEDDSVAFEALPGRVRLLSEGAEESLTVEGDASPRIVLLVTLLIVMGGGV